MSDLQLTILKVLGAKGTIADSSAEFPNEESQQIQAALNSLLARSMITYKTKETEVKRGTDILKAVAIGGQDIKVNVGIGRPFLYANSAYGEDGVRKLIQILKYELEMDMRLLGVTKINDLTSKHIDTRRLIGRDAINYLYDNVYSPIGTAKFKNEK